MHDTTGAEVDGKVEQAAEAGVEVADCVSGGGGVGRDGGGDRGQDAQWCVQESEWAEQYRWTLRDVRCNGRRRDITR